MSPEDELDFILKCIKHGEVKIDFVAVDKERGSANKVPGKSSRQLFDTILKKYGVRPSAGKTVSGTNTVITPASNLKPGRKRKAPAEVGVASIGSKKMKSERNL